MKKRKSIVTTNIPKIITFTGRFLQVVSKSLCVRFVRLLFTTPIRYALPKKERGMDSNSVQELVFIPQLDRHVMTYKYGHSDRKVLLVHGWSGRGTQLVKIADQLLEEGFSTISFDAPAHGKSVGNTTLMPDFIAVSLYLEQYFGTFEYTIGHSLGGMTILNAVKQGLNVKKAVIIGSGNSVNEIVNRFVAHLQLKNEISLRIRRYFEQKYGVPMESYSAYEAAKKVGIPILVIHDKHDNDVPFSDAEEIHKALPNSILFSTEQLGHRKILGDKTVIEKITEFLV